MMCALARPDEPPCVEEFHSTVSPPLTALPTMVHCCVGAAFQRTMPPNRFNARLSFGSVALFEGTGPVPAAKYVTTTLDIAVALTTNAPSLPGDANAVGVMPSVDEYAVMTAATVDAVAMPETMTSRTSMICVVAPPFKAMKVDVAAAEPCAAPTSAG